MITELHINIQQTKSILKLKECWGRQAFIYIHLEGKSFIIKLQLPGGLFQQLHTITHLCNLSAQYFLLRGDLHNGNKKKNTNSNFGQRLETLCGMECCGFWCRCQTNHTTRRHVSNMPLTNDSLNSYHLHIKIQHSWLCLHVLLRRLINGLNYSLHTPTVVQRWGIHIVYFTIQAGYKFNL